MKKQELRTQYLQKRKELTSKEISSLQENIYQQVFDLSLENIKNVHIFLSLQKFNELDTHPIIDYFRRENKQLVISKCNFEDQSLAHFYYNKDTKLKANKYGVLEPVEGKQVLESELDLIFVPLLISDAARYRVGYGKGFYDKFLAKCTKEAQKIGLNFFAPIPEIEDINPFDIALDHVIFPK